MSPQAQQHYHFIGIGGIGVGTLACLVLAQGHKVTGSDLCENAMTQALRTKGAEVFVGHRAEQIRGADWVIYSSAVRPDNPEMTEARRQRTPLLKRAQLLARLMENHTAVTVAGAHGKTTTTSMISSLLMESGMGPTCAVGGVLSGRPYQATLGKGRYFVAEVDESDGTFLYFNPDYSIVTNIDFEHIDYYHTWENILSTYRTFLARTRPGGRIIGCGDDERLMGLLKGCGREHWTYGFSGENDIRAENVRPVAGQWLSQEFDCFFQNKGVGTFRLRVPGRHNVLNALACIGAGLSLGLTPDVLKTCLANYQGVHRRFQVKGYGDDIYVVDDYGHHPTEIAATLKTARELGRGRIWTVFQPHRYSRTKYLLEEFVRVLSGADRLVVTDIYAAGEPALEGVSAQVLYERLLPPMGERVCYLKRGDIGDFLVREVKPGDLVLTLGAGDIYRVGEEMVAYLSKKEQKVAE